MGTSAKCRIRAVSHAKRTDRHVSVAGRRRLAEDTGARPMSFTNWSIHSRRETACSTMTVKPARQKLRARSAHYGHGHVRASDLHSYARDSEWG
jgi:hypothetical protein